jgi:hypothetical protein
VGYLGLKKRGRKPQPEDFLRNSPQSGFLDTVGTSIKRKLPSIPA